MEFLKSDIIEWRELCKTNKTIPIFSRDWWLDAVAPNSWNVHLYKKENDEIIGAFVYYYKEVNGIISIEKAPVSQNNGIWMNNETFGNYYNYRKYEERVMNEAIQDIYALGLKSYSQQFHYSIKNWLPFFWEYFKCVVRYTYVIDTTCSMQDIFKRFSQNNRNMIRKAEKIVHLSEDLTCSEFYEINKLVFERQDLEIPYSFELFKRIDDSCIQKECRKILAAYDENDVLHGAIYLVWDDDSVYYLFSGSDPKYRNSQAISYLLYKGIEFAKSINRKFDFEGSVIKQVEKNIRQFGGVQMPYFKIFNEFKEEK
ncbi:MAG: GNAT family N-acetyltransferase [Erysipelotrichaceae bacterium]